MTGKGDMETGKVAAKGGNGGERGKRWRKATGKVEKMGKGGMTGKGKAKGKGETMGKRERGNGTRRGEATTGKGDRWRGKVKGKQENMEKGEKRGKDDGEWGEDGNRQ